MTQDEFQVSVVVVEAGRILHGELDLFLKFGAPPGPGVEQHDARPTWNAAEGNTQMQVVLDARSAKTSQPGSALLRPGTWYAGVRGGPRPATYSLLFNRYDCPGNCSGHGHCNTDAAVESRACRCNDGWAEVYVL